MCFRRRYAEGGNVASYLKKDAATEFSCPCFTILPLEKEISLTFTYFRKADDLAEVFLFQLIDEKLSMVVALMERYRQGIHHPVGISY
jgi:hypothetical protein